MTAALAVVYLALLLALAGCGSDDGDGGDPHTISTPPPPDPLPLHGVYELVIVPAAQADIWSALWVVLLFGTTTVITMITIVVLILRGLSFVSFRKAEVYGHAVAGLVVLLCGFAVKFGL